MALPVYRVDIRNDRISLTAKGAAYLLSCRGVPAPLATYGDLFGVCDEPRCGEDRIKGESYCERHATVPAFG